MSFSSTSPSHSGAGGAIASLTSPTGTTTAPVSAVSVTFDSPISAFSLSQTDVQIQQLQNGSWTNIYSGSDLPAESLDSTGTELTLTLPEPLASGDYRVVLPPNTGLLYSDLTPVSALADNQVLGSFIINGQGPTLAGATPLGSPVSTQVSANGQLDLQSDPGAVDLYSFTLPSGHEWRLGAQVLASQIGSGLQSNLTLFNAQGVPIATSSIGQSSTPTDPYLFEGLGAGTYYLGVSGAANVPGSANGYNLAAGTPASNLPAQTGGAFQLDLLADPADTPATVLGFSLQYADPLDPHPTGFALAFSQPINTNTLLGYPSAGIELVNASGQTFPVTAVAQQSSLAQYSFLVNEDLPAGQYSVVVPSASSGGLTDLAGHTPVAPGQPAGTLATFSVSGTTDANPFDLGPLYAQAYTGISRSDLIAPGTSDTYRFVVTTEAYYKIQTSHLGGSLSIQILGPNGSSQTYDGGASGQTLRIKNQLTPGVYYVQFLNTGLTPSLLNLRLRDLESPQAFESLLNNGLGQEPALNVMSFSGTAAGLSASGALAASSTSWLGQPAIGNSGLTAVPGTTMTPSTSTVSTTPTNSPAGLYLTLGNTLVGRPSADADHISVVGPTAVTLSSSPALASVGQSLLPGINYGNPLLGAPDVTPKPFVVQAAPVNGALAVPVDAQPDKDVIADADFVTRAGNLAARLFALAPSDESEPEMIEDEVSESAPIAVVRDDTPAAAPEEDRVERADFGAPLTLGLATMMSLRLNPPLLRWFRRGRTRSAPSTGHPLRGPHSRF